MMALAQRRGSMNFTAVRIPEYRKCVIRGAGTKEWLLLEWKSITCSSLQVLFGPKFYCLPRCYDSSS